MPKRAFSITGLLKLLVVAVLAVCMLAAAAGCGAPRLSTPSGLNINELDLTLNWNDVSGAAYYTVRIRGNDVDDEVLASNNSYSLERYAPGGYTVSVRAEAGANAGNSSSRWSQAIEFERPYENGLTMELTDSNTAFEVTGIGTASGDIVIPDTYRGLPVTSVAERAFINNTSVTAVTVGANVKEIGDYAFANCYGIASLTLPEGLESIGANAFQSCREITSLTLPDSLTALGANAFQFCRGLTAVTIGNGLTELSASVFDNCTSLASVTIPDSVTTIGNSAFSRCTSLASVDIGANVAEIGDDAFSGCTALTSMTMPESVKIVGEAAFYGCTALADVTLGGATEQIGRAAFRDTALWKQNEANYIGDWFVGVEFTGDNYTVEPLKEGTVGIADYAFTQSSYNSQNQLVVEGYTFGSTYTLPDSVKYIGTGAFCNCDIPGIVIGGGAEIIGERAFAGSTIYNAVLGAYDSSAEGGLGESSLREIGNEAFSACGELADIAIPLSVERIGTYAFRDSGIWTADKTEVYAGGWLVGYNPSDVITTVAVDEGTVGVADYVFAWMDDIVTVSLPEGLNKLGQGTFYNCTGLIAVSLPEGLAEISDYTFYGCSNLMMPDLPSTLTRIGRSAFYRCALGTAGANNNDTDEDILELPAGVTEIGAYAFYDTGFEYEDPDATGSDEDRMKNGGIDAVIIGDRVESIGDYAFFRMGSLKQVTIGNSVKSIGSRAFYRCEELTSVTFGTAVESIGDYAFYRCTSLTSAILPATVNDVGNYAFYRCTSLERASLGSASRIGDYAFFGCAALGELSLPAQLTSIGNQAFRGCSAITGVTLGGNVSFIGSHAFYGCSLMTFYTSADSAAEGWNIRWNSSYRAVVWNCEISAEGYLVSFTYDEGSISNLSETTPLTAPVRDGYNFEGFATVSGGDVAYGLADIGKVPAGTTLYAVWAEA